MENDQAPENFPAEIQGLHARLAPLDQATESRLRRMATWCGGLVVSLAILCLLGWFLGIRFFTSMRPHYIPIASSTAFTLLIQGAILILQARGYWLRKGRLAAALVVVSLTMIYGLFTSIKYFIGVDLTYEYVMFPFSEQFGFVTTNRMSPITGASLGLSSLSLFFMLRPRHRGITRHLPGVLGGLVASVGFIGAIGYLFGTPVLYGSSIIPVSAMTVIGFILLGVGLMAAAGPRCFPMRDLVGPSTRARLLRVFLPVIVAAILFQGLLQVVIPQSFEGVSPAIVTALLALTFIVITSLVVVVAGRSIGEALDRAEAALKDSEAKYRRLMETANDAILITDADTGVIVEANRKAQDLLGLPKDKIIGMHQSQLHPPGEADWYQALLRDHAKTGGSTNDRSVVHSDGHLIPVEISAAITQVRGKNLVEGIFRDITQRRQAAEKINDLNILLKAVKHINEGLLRIKSEPELFQYTCDVLLRVPYIKFSWIGLVQPDNFEIKPVAKAGVEKGYLDIITVRWDDSEYGDGPTGEAIKTVKPFVRKCIETDLEPNPWRQEALSRGYKSSITLPLIHAGEVIGVLKSYAGVVDAFGKEEVEFLNQVAGDIAVGIRSLRLEQELIQSLIKLQVVMFQTVESIASMAEIRDPYTAGHQRGVTRLACTLAREMGLADDRIEGIRVAGFLHDIGKIVIPAEILNKPGKLSEYELNLIKTHSQVGHDILLKIDFPWPVAQIVLQHHERLDGSGYPLGLTGSAILLEARILAVADVMEAMAAYRPYRPGLGVDKALEEITRNQGILYDPQVVEACVQLFTKHGFQFSEEKIAVHG
jgi:PAS domain S-box-containing protein/putative nucleotidyltransferase with HDIG domain